ncbi:MAG: hypothetical protein PCFJNLEI_02179 [Verrucomicrobiae bacterium]|nr:hypothetical protein [Verrucomicrobiae bacterium]
MKTLLTFILMTAIMAVAESPPCRWWLPGMFSENMVLQRDVPMPIWGWGPDGESVTVQIADQKVSTTVTNGRWQVTLKPLPAGGPHTLLILPKDETQIQMFTQVMVGDVWLVCGQSNMLMPLDETTGAADVIATAQQHPGIRVFQTGHRNPHTLTNVLTAPVAFWGAPKWEAAAYLAPRSSKTDIPGGPAAISYYFARALDRHFEGKIPLGMIEVGAIMRGECWIADAEIAGTPELAGLRGKPYPNATSRCFAANIAPLAPFPVRGFIYYQGEMNAGDDHYQHTLPALIRSWRRAWGNDQLPFLIVQLPGFHKHDPAAGAHALDMPAEFLAKLQQDTAAHGFIVVREAQRLTRATVPHTGLAVTIDLGEPFNIHPPRKREVGERLALLARQLTYGETNLLAEAPLPKPAKFSGDKVVVQFVNATGGLVVRDDKPVGFEIAGANGVFHLAEVTVSGDTVTARSSGVPQPQAIRYAWAGYPQVSLFNQAGLPATPFEMRK